MKWTNYRRGYFGNPTGRQQGVITTFTGVLILVLLALMMFFAIRVGVFEQRVAANDSRQKQAFHAAESGIQHAKEFFIANNGLITSDTPDLWSGGRDGWLTDNLLERRWLPCDPLNGGPDPDVGPFSHPCFGAPSQDQRERMFYYSFGNSTLLPLDTDAILPGTTETVAVEALLCILELKEDEADPIPVQGCAPNLDQPVFAGNLADGTHFLITILARGKADCSNGNCNAEAMISEQIASFGGGAGGQSPTVPLTTKTTFPPTGAAEVVANPNGGGIGVPSSVWMNRNPSCTPDGSAIDPSEGSWATCEMHEWYELEKTPENWECPGSCSCTFSEALSYTHGTEDVLGIDLIEDEEFPCDLFRFYFGVPRASYEIVKGFSKVLSDCSTLGPDSFGIYWISGSECIINANTQVGSSETPVLLITASAETRMAGGAKIFGVLYIADVEVAGATFESLGGNIVYGQVINDANFGSYQGTFQVVYNENAILRAAGSGGLGDVIGGWSDFHAVWE
jgi:hypothetical protein